MPEPILQADEEQLQALWTVCVPLAADPELQAELHETERRLAVVAAMRTLYRDVRADKARLVAAR